MAEAYYPPTPATDGATMNPVPGAAFQVFEISDQGVWANPLSLRIGSGNLTTTVNASDGLATLPGVYVTSPNFEHIWKSGSFEWRRDSIDGAKLAVEEAKIAAETAATNAGAAAEADLAARVAAGEFKGAPGQDGSNVVPTAEAIKAETNPANARNPITYVYNVTAYGASTDGVTAARNAIHAARDAAGVGGKLYFPPGIYSCDGVQPLSGQTWELHPQATLRIHPNASTLSVMRIEGVADFTLTGGALDGGGTAIAGSGGHMFHVANSQRIKIRDTTFKNSRGYGLAGGGVTGLSIRNCFYLNCADGVGNYGYHNTYGASSEVEFCDNFVDMRGIPETDLNTGGFTSYGNATAPNKKVLITGNRFFVNKGTGPSSTGCVGVLYSEDVIVANNICIGSGISISVAASSKRVTVANNTMSGFYDYGLEFANVEDCVANGNIIDARGAKQFAVSLNGSTKRTVLTGNSIECGSVVGKAGIQLTSAVIDTTITGNIVKSRTAGTVGIIASIATRVFVTSNHFYGEGTAAYAVQFLNSIGQSMVNNNSFNGYSIAAVRFDATQTTVVDYISVKDNLLKATPSLYALTGSPAATLGTNTQLTPNLIVA